MVDKLVSRQSMVCDGVQLTRTRKNSELVFVCDAHLLRSWVKLFVIAPYQFTPAIPIPPKC
ncbi:MAG: hypothetical protein ACPGRD_02250, partial [Planktomarina sp.]